MMIPFDEKFPVHTETLTNVEDLNKILEEDIREATVMVCKEETHLRNV